jgi:SAM-dependent methyltransferase
MKKIGSIYNNGTYLHNHQDWHLNDSKWKAKKIIDLLSENDVTPKSICEIGCGAGGILLALNDMISNECDFTGYEISTDAFKICSKKSSDNVNFVFDNGISSSNKKHDIALIIDVVEHVENYLKFLRDIKDSNLYSQYVFHVPLDISVISVIRIGGIMNARRDSGHIHYFTKDIALEALKECGFKTIKWKYTYSSIEIKYNTLSSKLLKYPRKLLYKIHPNLAVRLLGGASLIVLAE